MDYIIPFFSALLGAGLLSFIQFLIQRNDDKNDRISAIETQLEAISFQLKVQERDQCRTQMLLLISDYPTENAELMKLAKHYFKDLHGDWYMTNIFNRWLTAQQLGKPEWFNDKE